MTTSVQETDSNHTAVIRLVELGWHVLPCHGIADGRCTCGQPHKSPKDVGKHPAIDEWTNKSTDSVGVVDRWWEENPDHNVAVNCKASGLVVIDIDPRSGGDESFALLEARLTVPLPPTVTALTGRHLDGDAVRRGRHLYFRCSPAIKLRGSIKGLPGIDIKHNGYVIAAPSAHSSGVRYEWVEGCSPFETEPADLPDELLEILRKGRITTESSGIRTPIVAPRTLDPHVWHELRSRTGPPSPYGAAALAGLADDVRTAQEGERNNTLNRAAFRVGQLLAEGHLTIDDADRALRGAARDCAGGPLDDREIDALLGTSGRGYESGAASVLLGDGAAPGSDSDESEADYLERIGLLDWERLFAEEYEEDWLVPGIICRGRGHVLYSDAGVGKSLLMREVSVRLASGQSVLGLPAREPVRILYLDQENHPHGDVKSSLLAMGFGPSDLENLAFLSFPDIPMLDTLAGQREIEKLLVRFEPELVIFDTASRFVEGEENSNDTWNRLYNYVGKVLKALDIAYIRIDHEGKSAAAGQRGGSAKKGDVDLVWHLEELAQMRFRLKNEKSRAFLAKRQHLIVREKEPLRHLIEDDAKVDIGAIFRAHFRKEQRMAIVRDFMAGSAANHRMGYQKMWGSLKEDLQPLDGTRDEMKEIRQWILDGEPEQDLDDDEKGYLD